MTRFYRFISSEELHTILAKSFTNDVMASENSAIVHLFKEETPTIIADHKYHYALDMTDFFTGNFDKKTLTKETAMKTLRGVVSDDYLIALEFDNDPCQKFGSSRYSQFRRFKFATINRTHKKTPSGLPF